MTDTRCTDVELRWNASPLALSLATCAAVAMAVALIGSRWQLIVFAAPLLGVLVSLPWQRPRATVTVAATPGLVRCFETEVARLQIWATAEHGASVRLTVEGIEGAAMEVMPGSSGAKGVVPGASGAKGVMPGASGAKGVVPGSSGAKGVMPGAKGMMPGAPGSTGMVIELSADRWGRYPVTVGVDVVARGGLLSARAVTGRVEVADVFVFPIAPAQSTALPRTELLDRLGTHLTRHVGRGIEYGNIRGYVPGDQLRTVNWPVSARRRSLHVTERLSERAADVVAMVDTYAQPPGPATEATERTVRGAVQVVQSALRNGDRAGVVALGGTPRWLGPDIGRRQFYRVLDAALGAGAGHETTTGTLAPRAAIPPGAIVIAFSTLLDTDFALALIDLCRRGHLVVAVDVLDGAPFDDLPDPLIARMWSMQRSFMYRDMRTIGVDVVSWPGESTLDQVLHLVPDHRPIRR